MGDARAFFDAVARRYDRQYALSGSASRERLARVVALLGGRRRVLVLGIGTGRELPALLDAGHEVVGLDVSSAMIDECNKRSRTVPILLADFWAPLPLADASFDAVVALHGTLAHPPGGAEEPLVALGHELARVLTAGGLFLAEVPAAEALSRLGVERTGASTFVHRDEASGVAIAGVALARERWPALLGEAFETAVSTLGEVEHLVQARRTSLRAC